MLYTKFILTLCSSQVQPPGWRVTVVHSTGSQAAAARCILFLQNCGALVHHVTSREYFQITAFMNVFMNTFMKYYSLIRTETISIVFKLVFVFV